MAAVPYRTTFRRLLGFLRPYKWSLVVSILLAVISQAGQFGAAFLTGDGLAKAVQGEHRHALNMIVAAIVLVGVARAIAMAGRRLTAVTAAERRRGRPKRGHEHGVVGA